MSSPAEPRAALAFLPTVRSGLHLLSSKEIRLGIWLIIAILVGSFVELVAVAAVLPFVNVVVQPTAIQTNQFLHRLYQWVGAPEPSSFVSLIGFGVIILMIVSGVANWCLLYLQNWYAARCQNRLAKDLLDRCIRAPYSWFLARNSLTLSRLVYDDVVLWSRGLIQRLMMMVGNVIVMMMTLALVLTFSLGTGILVITAVAIVGYAATRFTRPLLTHLATTKREALDAVTLTANQALAGIKDVKLTSREAHFSELFRTAYATVTGAHAGLNVWQETPSIVMALLAQVALVTLALVFWNMGIESGQIATQIALLIIVATKVAPAVGRLAVSVSAMVNALPHVKAIQDTLESIEVEARRVGQRRGGGKPVGGWRWIRLERVGYRYPDSPNWALREVTIRLERNRSCGIVGPSAAGKSTLVDLLVGLLAPVEGSVCVDDESLESFDLKSWQRRIGYVPQMPFLADASLRANVAFGVPPDEVDDDRVLECLSLANLADLPAELEQALDTRLGERGFRLSGGQRQRVAIARALYGRPEILVLDEAMSALDTVTESEIQAALTKLRGQVTLVTIAHRLSTVATCDEIFVLEDGRPVGRGTYAELCRSHELFRRMAATPA
jgi:ATP-binding cassette, subfamily B, bacterial PglK